MRCYLMRHAAAADPGGVPDALRPLTEQGRQEARQAGEALKERQAAITSIQASPRLRARETAEIVAGVLGVAVTIREDLNCGAGGGTYREAIGDGDVLIVGHNPEISAIASAMAGQSVGFRPATVACIEDGRLAWLLHP
jgi:phosphohistidine phosphatase